MRKVSTALITMIILMIASLSMFAAPAPAQLDSGQTAFVATTILSMATSAIVADLNPSAFLEQSTYRGWTSPSENAPLAHYATVETDFVLALQTITARRAPDYTARDEKTAGWSYATAATQRTRAVPKIDRL